MNNKKNQLDRYTTYKGGREEWVGVHTFWRKTLHAFYFILYALRPIWRQLSHILPYVLLFYTTYVWQGEFRNIPCLLSIGPAVMSA